MGPSMSNPDRFKQLNKQRHLIANQRKHRTQISLDSKIKFKTISDFPSKNHRQTSQHKTIMIREQKTIDNSPQFIKMNKKSNENDQEAKEKLETPKKIGQNQQNCVEITKNNKDEKNMRQNSRKETEGRKFQQSIFMSSESKQLGIRKIVLNNHTYEIDIQKMKNRRLQSKERYTESILRNANNMSKLNVSNTKPSFTTNSIPNGVSTLELQSQLHPITEHTNNLQVSQEGLLLRQNSRQSQRRVLEGRNIGQNEQEKVRAEYYDEYADSFESRYSREYQEKVKKSGSDKKILKAYKMGEVGKQIHKMQGHVTFSQYEIRFQKKILSKKQQTTSQSFHTKSQPETALIEPLTNHKKPLKLIKVIRNKNQFPKPKLLE